MSPTRLSPLGLAGAFCALALHGAAFAQERPGAEPTTSVAADLAPIPLPVEPVIEEQGHATASAIAAPGTEATAATPTVLNGAELDALAGGDGGVAVAVSNQNLQAVNTGNRVIADTVVSGSVTLDRSAFSNFSGLGNIVVNTGNNNNLQSSLSVSVVMPPH